MKDPGDVHGPIGECHHICPSIDQRFVHAVHRLTGREVDVLMRIVGGETNQQIACRLNITERTVRAHVAQIFAKEGVESRVQAGVLGYAYCVSHCRNRQ